MAGRDSLGFSCLFQKGVEVSRELPQAPALLGLSVTPFQCYLRKSEPDNLLLSGKLSTCTLKCTNCACTIEISSDPGTDSPCLILLHPQSHIWTLMEELGNQACVSALKIPVFPSKQVGKQGFPCSIKTA